MYVGHAGKGGHTLNYRLGDLVCNTTDLENIHHTFSKKLLKEDKFSANIDKLRDYFLNECYVKTVEIETVRKARIIEAILIDLLNPKYNSE